jgi:hypothetical protein
MTPRDAHGFADGEFIHHETGLREQTGFVVALDGFIDRAAAAEVVASEDEVFQGTRRFSLRDDARGKA